MEESLKIWVTEEFRKIMLVLLAYQAALEEVRAQNP